MAIDDDETGVQALTRLAKQQFEMLRELTVQIAALRIYVERQPGFDRAAFAAIEDACRIFQTRQAAQGQPLSLALLIASLQSDPGPRQ